MKKTRYSLSEKASVSLCSLMERNAGDSRSMGIARVAGVMADPGGAPSGDVASVLIESQEDKAVFDSVGAFGAKAVEKLAEGFFSATVRGEEARKLIDNPNVRRIETKKESSLHLSAVQPEIRLTSAAGARTVAEDGSGVLIGIIDSGFDLSHPAFRDSNGKLRVAGLLDQTNGNSEFTNAQLETGWSNGSNPGADEHGHGTHVSSIAGGTRFHNLEGVAPKAGFLLVKTDFRNTANAVAWVFQKAAGVPCAINMSLGHHFGSHDGTSSEERLHEQLTGPGKIIVVSAGNERDDNIHIGSRFTPGSTQEAAFNVLRRQDGPPGVALTAWYSQSDVFEGALIAPSGQIMALPAIGFTDRFSGSTQIEISRKKYPPGNLIQVQIVIDFPSSAPPLSLQNWKLRFNCVQASVGRLDAWFANSGFAIFRDSPLVEKARTVGMAATGKGCLAVASYVDRVEWDSDEGHEQATQLVLGQISPFSSMGPSRDGRQKPEIAAPGQFVSAALASGSRLAGLTQRADTANRVLTIEGTSMSAPVMTGVVALMLQKKPALTLADVRTILQNTSRRDAAIGAPVWDPNFGFGKIDVAAAIAAIGMAASVGGPTS